MFGKLKALYNLFRVGESVIDPAKWKGHQITTTVLAGLFIAIVKLAKAFNYDLPIDDETATTIAGGVIAAVNVVLTITTTKTIGVLSEKPVNYPNISLPSYDKDGNKQK